MVDKHTWRFPAKASSKLGVHSWCTECMAAYHVVNRDRAHITMRRNHLKRKYNLTVDEMLELGKQQDNKCAVCRQELTYKDHGYAVDHDHKTGKIRGLLCFRCNRSIGQFEDDPMLLRAAADYLERE